MKSRPCSFLNLVFWHPKRLLFGEFCRLTQVWPRYCWLFLFCPLSTFSHAFSHQSRHIKTLPDAFPLPYHEMQFIFPVATSPNPVSLILRLNFATCACSPRVDCFSVSHFSERASASHQTRSASAPFYALFFSLCAADADGREMSIRRALLSDVSRAAWRSIIIIAPRRGCSLWIRAAGAGFNEGRSQTNPLIIRRTPSALSIRLPPATQIKRAILLGFKQCGVSFSFVQTSGASKIFHYCFLKSQWSESKSRDTYFWSSK